MMKCKVDLDTRVLDALPNRVRRNADRVVHSATERVAQNMRDGAPVDDGELKDEIHTEYGRFVGWAVSDAPHTIHVEYGTSKMPAQPFIRPAVRKERRELIHGAKKVFK